VKAIITLAHALELRVVAEGMETEQQLQMLRDCRCDEIQGYLYRRPLPYGDFAAFLAEGQPTSAAGAATGRG
jgi:EAL domain-containing protein (putative c-di-GMP-specific phosphodiesterase class I)